MYFVYYYKVFTFIIRVQHVIIVNYDILSLIYFYNDYYHELYVSTMQFILLYKYSND